MSRRRWWGGGRASAILGMLLVAVGCGSAASVHATSAPTHASAVSSPTADPERYAREVPGDLANLRATVVQFLSTCNAGTSLSECQGAFGDVQTMENALQNDIRRDVPPPTFATTEPLVVAAATATQDALQKIIAATSDDLAAALSAMQAALVAVGKAADALGVPAFVASPSATPAPTPVPTPSPPALVYAVGGSGTALVTYFVTGFSEQQERVTLPWSKVLDAAPPTPVVNAQHTSGGGPITCSITRNGNEIAHAQSTGEYAVVQCVP